MGLIKDFFPNINEYELKLLERYFGIIIKNISLKFYVPEKELLQFIYKTPANTIGIITLIIPFYNKTFNNVMTLADLFYNKIYTNKYIETLPHEKKSIDQILENNTKCLLSTIDIVANKLYYNWNEVLPITMDLYKQEKLYLDTFHKIYNDKDVSKPFGLDEGDIFNVIANDLYINYNCVEWLLFENEGKSYDEILKSPKNSIQYQLVVKTAVEYMLKYFPSFNKIHLKSDDYIKIMEPQNKPIWSAYLEEVFRVFNKSWYSTKFHHIEKGVSRYSLYLTFKSFSNSKKNILWGTLKPDELEAYRNSLKKLLEENNYLRENLADIVFETLIKKGCLSKLNLNSKTIETKNTFFFLENNKINVPINKFYTMNWISQLNFFNHFINNRVIFVTGGTGVGKSTQSPVLIMYADIMIYYNTSSRIVCSVPRKNAVENNCTYIRKGIGLPKDNFSVQFQHKDDRYVPTFKMGKDEVQYEKYNQTLTIVTDEILKNTLLKNIYCVFKEKFTYNHILIDESHEHKINMDLILTILKHGMLKFNFHTKLFIISATMDEDDESYRRFFSQARDDSIFFKMWRGDFHFLDRRIHISPYNVQNNFTIKEFYLPESMSVCDYDQSEKHAIEKVAELCNITQSGTILVFSIGQMEIKKMVETMNSLTSANTIAFPLYSVLPPSFKISISSTILEDWLYEKNYVMEILENHSNDWFSHNLPFPKKKYSRYIIVGTNIVEASLTISTLKYVVETGYEKVSVFNKKKAEEEIKVMEISESSRIQRRGRVGRVSDGFVFYMYAQYSRKNNPIQKEFKNSDISSYLFNIIGFVEVATREDITSYLEKSAPELIPVASKDKLFFDGFSPETIAQENFFLIEPTISVKRFYEFHKNHKYWRYFFNQTYIQHIQYLRNIITTHTYLTMYQTFALVLFYQKYGVLEFLKILEHILKDYITPNSLVSNYKVLHVNSRFFSKNHKAINIEINRFIAYIDENLVRIYSDEKWEHVLKDLYYE